MAFSKETNYVDSIIELVLSECFEGGEQKLTDKEAEQRFRDRVTSTCLYFSKVKVFQQAYDLRLAQLRSAAMQPIEIELPSFYHLSMLYLSLLRGTILDPEATCVNLSSTKAIGNIPPRLYVLCVYLASVSARRSPSDSMLMVNLSGKSSCGKSTLLGAITQNAKPLANESFGVGRFALSPSQTALYFHDVNFAMLTAASQVQIVKNVLRGETCGTKVRNTTETIPPSYVLMCSNENLFAHTKQGRMVTLPNYTCGRINRENVLALKARLIECFVMKRGPAVNKDVFLYGISLEQARCALATLLFKEFKELDHPLQCASPTLLPAVLQGMQMCERQVPAMLGLSPGRFCSILDGYRTVYRESVRQRLADDNMAPLGYDDD